MNDSEVFESGWTALDAGHVATLRAALTQILAEFAASLNSGKPVGHTAGSLQRAVRAIRVAEDALDRTAAP